MSNHSHGDPTLALTNLSGTTASNSAGLTLSLSAGNPGGGGGAAISAGANSQNTGTVNFSEGNGITFGLSNNGVLTATVKTDYQSSGNYLTTAMLSNASTAFAGLGFTSNTTAGTAVVATLSTNGLSMRVPNYLTTAQPVGNYLTTARASNDAVGLNTAATAVTWTVNSSGISLNAGAYLTTAALSNHSHGNPTLALTNLTGATASNSAGFTLSLEAAAPGAGGGIAVQGNGANGTATFSTGTLALHAGNNVTLSTGAQAISIHAPAPGGGGYTKSRFNPFMEAVGAEGQVGQSTLHFHPVPDPNNFCFDRMYFDVRGTEGTQTNSTGSYTINMHAGFYTRNGASLSLLASSSTSLGLTKSGTVRASVNNGPRVMTMGWTTTITQADLWLGLVSFTQSAGANIYTLSQYLASDVNSNFSGVLGAASAATLQNVLGLGVYTAATNALPNGPAFSQINGSASQYLRVPLYYFVSQTA